jgi:hypothetical protein
LFNLTFFMRESNQSFLQVPKISIPFLFFGPN